MPRVKARRIDFSPDEYLAGVLGRLTLEEQGAYWAICSLIYSKGGPIDDDEAWFTRVFAGAHWRTIRTVLASLEVKGKIVRANKQIMVPRCQEELDRANERVASAIAAGHRGGRPRQAQDEFRNGSGMVQDALRNGSGSTQDASKSTPKSRRSNGLAKGLGSGNEKLTTNDQLPTKDSPPLVSPPPDSSAAAAAPAPPANGKGATSVPRDDAAHGSRLAEAWTLDDKLFQQCLTIGLSAEEIEREADRFRDHFHAQPGRYGRKTDWGATFRNWCRRAHEDRQREAARNGTGRGGPRPGGVVGAINRLVAAGADRPRG